MALQQTLTGEIIRPDDLPFKCCFCGAGYQTLQGKGKHEKTCARRPRAPAASSTSAAGFFRPGVADAPVAGADTPAPADTPIDSEADAREVCRGLGIFAVSDAAPDSAEFRRRASPKRKRKRGDRAGTVADGRKNNKGAPGRVRRETEEIAAKVKQIIDYMKEGFSQIAAAHKAGVSQSNASKWLKENRDDILQKPSARGKKGRNNTGFLERLFGRATLKK